MRELKKLDLCLIKSRREAEAEATKFIPDAITRGFLLQNLVGDPERPESYKWRLNLDVLYSTLTSWVDTPDLQRFPGQTLFIGGGASGYIKPEYTDQIKALYPSAQIAMIPGGSHYVHYERPAEFVDIAVPFLLRR
jgi:pimeloyl-ACP methyl ester carboxylesterase